MRVVRSVCPVTGRPISMRTMSPAERAAEIERVRLANAKPVDDEFFTHPFLRKLGITAGRVWELTHPECPNF